MSCQDEDIVVLAAEGSAKLFLLRNLQDKDVSFLKLTPLDINFIILYVL